MERKNNFFCVHGFEGSCSACDEEENFVCDCENCCDDCLGVACDTCIWGIKEGE